MAAAPETRRSSEYECELSQHIDRIDISSLSQSELHSLSLFTNSLNNSSQQKQQQLQHQQLVVPIIDPSQFNESAGSRRQTYSRLRRPQSSSSRRRVTAGILHETSSPVQQPPPHDDRERTENHAIISHLKQLISNDSRFDQIFQTPPEESGGGEIGLEMEPVLGVRKRKRGRKPKAKGTSISTSLGQVGMEIVNKNGDAVDIVALENSENPFGEELRRRTIGLVSEEELLGFMRDLDGQWGSRRKRRKFVDAAQFGDALPIGWKLLLGLKRKEGHAWIYCRRYISPTGQQFLSCKEVASFLESFFGLNNAERHGADKTENMLDCKVNTETHANEDAERRQDVRTSSAIVVSSKSDEPVKQVNTLEIENLADVQIHDLFECHKCSMTFAEKDSYLQHLLSFHQRTTRRYRLGSTVGDGVIIKDGKYECQFCHKVFLERRRYNGHVGIHVRNYVRRVEESPGPATIQKRTESPTGEVLPSRNLKMDALIEIAQNSILETSTTAPNEESKGGTTLDPNMNFSVEVPASSTRQEMIIDSKPGENDLDECMIDKIDEEQQDSEHTLTDGSMDDAEDLMDFVDAKMDDCMVTAKLSTEENNDKISEISMEKDTLASTSNELDVSVAKQDRASECHHVQVPSIDKTICDVVDNMNCTSALEHPSPVEADKSKQTEPIVSNSQHGPANDRLEPLQLATEGNVLQKGICDSSMSLVPLLTVNAIQDKGDVHLIGVGQTLAPLTNGEERLEEAAMDSTNSKEMQRALGPSDQCEPENMAGSNHLPTACVWCGVEFKQEIVDSELQTDSVGFMCPACKAKTPEHIG